MMQERKSQFEPNLLITSIDARGEVHEIIAQVSKYYHCQVGFYEGFIV